MKSRGARRTRHARREDRREEGPAHGTPCSPTSEASSTQQRHVPITTVPVSGPRDTPVQAKDDEANTKGLSPGEVHSIADKGTAGPGGSIPHLSRLQRQFGIHDLTSIRAHRGDVATTSARAMGAKAFARGNDVVFAEKHPSIKDTAHEITHIIQQRHGLRIASGVGSEGDVHEQQADQVAAAVGRGGSVEHLLPGGARQGIGHGPVQRLEGIREEGWTRNKHGKFEHKLRPKAAWQAAAKAVVAYHHPSESADSTGRAVDIGRFRNPAAVTAEFVTREHMNAIGKYCRAKNVILSVRDTGKLSLDRVEEGAKPKPHTILEKSIKPSSLQKQHPEAAAALKSGHHLEVPPQIGGVSLDDLKGFVGHWSASGKLMGLRVDKRDVDSSPKHQGGGGDTAHAEGLAKLRPFVAGAGSSEPYISLASFPAFREAMGHTWKQFLYTGDYDLHEVYQHNKALREASSEKAGLLSGLNRRIAADAPAGSDLPSRSGGIEVEDAMGTRDGKRKLPASHLHATPGSDYAMIQHGDQMGYITNQIHEGRLKKETIDGKAQMVPAVASEAPGKLAWCVRGDWYVTANKKEHSELRAALNVTAGSGWQAKTQQAMADGSSRTMEHQKSQKNWSKHGVHWSREAHAKPSDLKPWHTDKGRYEPGADTQAVRLPKKRR